MWIRVSVGQEGTDGAIGSTTVGEDWGGRMPGGEEKKGGGLGSTGVWDEAKLTEPNGSPQKGQKSPQERVY